MDIREKLKLMNIVCDSMDLGFGCVNKKCNNFPCLTVEKVVNALIASGVILKKTETEDNNK